MSYSWEDAWNPDDYIEGPCRLCRCVRSHHPACPENPSDALASLAVVLGDAYAEAVLAEEGAGRLIAQIDRVLS